MKLKKRILLEFSNRNEYPLCNLCGKSADWLVLFYDDENGKTYATTRCCDCFRKPEPQLNGKIPYNNLPLWYGSWAFDFKAGENENIG